MQLIFIGSESTSAQPNQLTSARKSEQNLLTAGTIIQEKIKNEGGEPTIRKWLKGGFLGKGGFAKVYEFTNYDTSKFSHKFKIELSRLLSMLNQLFI